MFRINVSQLKTKMDNVARYYHVFATEIDGIYGAQEALELLRRKFRAPEFKISLHKWETTGCELDIDNFIRGNID